MSSATAKIQHHAAAAAATAGTRAATTVALETLRALLPAPLPQVPGMPTGVDALDRALASNGLPRGRLTEVVGATGKLTLLRQIVDATLQRNEWVAYIDASRTLAPRDWAHLADVARMWIVRPPEAARAAWCADVLLRSAAFSLVVLDSAPAISRGVAIRLMGLARESNAALVVVSSTAATRLGGAVRLRVHRRRQRLRVAIEKGARVGTADAGHGSRLQQVMEVSCASGGRGVARRLCTHPEVPDRRGVARTSGGRRGKGGRAATPAYAQGGMLQVR